MDKDDTARAVMLEILGRYAECEAMIDIITDLYLRKVPDGIQKALIRRPLNTETQERVLRAVIKQERIDGYERVPARHRRAAEIRNALAHGLGSFDEDGHWAPDSMLMNLAGREERPPVTLQELQQQKVSMDEHLDEVSMLAVKVHRQHLTLLERPDVDGS